MPDLRTLSGVTRWRLDLEGAAGENKSTVALYAEKKWKKDKNTGKP